MTLITLIGEEMAREGAEFYFLGPLTECKDCRLKGVCFNLEQGSRYRVSEVRDAHLCREGMRHRVLPQLRQMPCAREDRRAEVHRRQAGEAHGVPSRRGPGGSRDNLRVTATFLCSAQDPFTNALR